MRFRSLHWVHGALTLFAPLAAQALDNSSHAIGAIQCSGLERTSEQAIIDLLPRKLPTVLQDQELEEFRRRVKNLGLFDLVEVNVVDHTLVVHVRRKFTFSPIVDFSSGKTLADSKVTIGGVENDIDGYGTRLGAKASYSERGLNFNLWLNQHVYRPRTWAAEYEVFYAGSGFRFEGVTTTWHRNRFGGKAEFISPFSYGRHFRYEFQLNAYREVLSGLEGSTLPHPDGVYVGTTSEVIFDRYTWNDLAPHGFRSSLELRPGVFVGPKSEARHEGRIKVLAALKLTDRTALLSSGNATLVNSGNPNHSGLVGSQQGVRGLPDSLYRTRLHAFTNLEFRHAVSLGKRWYFQAVAFTDIAMFQTMDQAGAPGPTLGAWSTGLGIRILPTALVDTLLRLDAARLHYPTENWFLQFGINQYF